MQSLSKITIVGLSAIFTFACSSAPVAPQAQPDVVLSRMDNASSRPSWVKESEPFRVEKGIVLSMGQTEIPGDHRVEAAYRIAENNAKAAIAGAIEQRLSFVFQNAEEGTGMDSSQARYIGGEASNLLTSSIRPANRYYEKVAKMDSYGERRVVFRVFTTVQIPEADFRKAVLDAVKRAEGKGGISAGFAKKVDRHWDNLTGFQESRTPASAE